MFPVCLVSFPAAGKALPVSAKWKGGLGDWDVMGQQISSNSGSAEHIPLGTETLTCIPIIYLPAFPRHPQPFHSTALVNGRGGLSWPVEYRFPEPCFVFHLPSLWRSKKLLFNRASFSLLPSISPKDVLLFLRVGDRLIRHGSDLRKRCRTADVLSAPSTQCNVGIIRKFIDWVEV